MPTTEPTTGADLEALEQERVFLLRSLADLDAEYEAGDIDDDDYRSLTNDYTARTAAVLRAIEAGTSPKKRPAAAPRTAGTAGTTGTAGRTLARSTTGAGNVAPAPAVGQSALLTAALRSRRRWRRVAVVVVVVVFGAVAAWALAQSSGTRLPGQTASGNSQLTGTTVAGGIDPRLANASDLVNQGKVADALKLYDDVLKDDPNQPVALADGGWLEAQAGLSANRSDLVDSGLVKIEQAEKVAPTFADAHFFRGFLLLRAKNDAPGAVTELRYYLGAIDPTAPQVPSVQSLLQEAIKAAGANVPPGPNAPTATTATSATTAAPG